MLSSLYEHARNTIQPTMYRALCNADNREGVRKKKWYIKYPLEFDDNGHIIKYHLSSVRQCVACNLYADKENFTVTQENGTSFEIQQCPSCWRRFLATVEAKGVEEYFNRKQSFEQKSEEVDIIKKKHKKHKKKK